MTFEISLQEWQKMNKDRISNRFGCGYYANVILPKLKNIYIGCVPCVLNHYLKNQIKLHF